MLSYGCMAIPAEGSTRHRGCYPSPLPVAKSIRCPLLGRPDPPFAEVIIVMLMVAALPPTPIVVCGKGSRGIDRDADLITF